jgi:hypothetical protein
LKNDKFFTIQRAKGTDKINIDRIKVAYLENNAQQLLPPLDKNDFDKTSYRVTDPPATTTSIHAKKSYIATKATFPAATNYSTATKAHADTTTI